MLICQLTVKRWGLKTFLFIEISNAFTLVIFFISFQKILVGSKSQKAVVSALHTTFSALESRYVLAAHWRNDLLSGFLGATEYQRHVLELQLVSG